MQVAEARAQLQKAVNLSHPVKTARYLTLSAAACLNYGLKRCPPGAGRLLVLLPVAYAQVLEHVKAQCPDVSDLLLKLQGRTGSKYFTIGRAHASEPLMVVLNLNYMITPPQRHYVTHILADIELTTLTQGNKLEASQPGALKAAASHSASQLAPSHSTGSIQNSQAGRPSSTTAAVLTVQRPGPGSMSYPKSSSDVSFADPVYGRHMPPAYPVSNSIT